MCVRFNPLTAEEAQSDLDTRGTDYHAIRYTESPDPRHNARLGSTIPLFVPDDAGDLEFTKPEWDFPLDSKPYAAFNARIETALEQLRRGRRGVWVKAIAEAAASFPCRHSTKVT